jgi:hypothetical protein
VIAVSLQPAIHNCAGIFKQSMGARNREGIGLYIGYLESILGLLISFKVRAQGWSDNQTPIQSHVRQKGFQKSNKNVFNIPRKEHTRERQISANLSPK